jgi:glucokinase
MTYLLAGDIGGTNTRLKLIRAEIVDLFIAKTLDLAAFQRYFSEYSIEQKPSPKYESLIQIVDEFLKAAQAQLGGEIKVLNACFGIAGPIINQTCTLTNIPHWPIITVNELQKKLGTPQVELINDFVAIGHGISTLSPSDDLDCLQKGQTRSDEPKAIIGAGTGLGEGFTIPSGRGNRVVATEGGHTDFAARTELEFKFFQNICQRPSLDRLSYDRVLSGSGIVAIYQFLRDTSELSENPDIAHVVKRWEQQTEQSVNPAVDISKAAISKTDPLSQQTMEMFLSIYGAEAKNLALKTLPLGGLYLAGGIAPQNLELLRNGVFAEAFKSGGRMSRLLETIPINVIRAEAEVGLRGAVARAASL